MAYDGYCHDDLYLKQAAETVVELCEQQQVHHPIFIGHSMGGHLALACDFYTSIQPKKIILIDSGLPLTDKARDQYRAFSQRLVTAERDAAYQQLIAAFTHPADDKQIVQQITADMLKMDAHYSCRFLEEIGDVDDLAYLKNCHCPLLYVAAFLPLSSFDMISQYHSHAIYKQITNAGYFLTLLTPHRLNQLIEDFVKNG